MTAAWEELCAAGPFEPGLLLECGHLKETKPNRLMGLGDVFMATSSVSHFEIQSQWLPKGGVKQFGGASGTSWGSLSKLKSQGGDVTGLPGMRIQWQKAASV